MMALTATLASLSMIAPPLGSSIIAARLALLNFFDAAHATTRRRRAEFEIAAGCGLEIGAVTIRKASIWIMRPAEAEITSINPNTDCRNERDANGVCLGEGRKGGGIWRE